MGETRDINTAEEGARIKTRDKCPLSRDRKSQLLFLYLFISLHKTKRESGRKMEI